MIRDMTKCRLCEQEDIPLNWIDGWNAAYCAECEEFERTFDIDKYEEDKRRRIAEENEY